MYVPMFINNFLFYYFIRLHSSSIQIFSFRALIIAINILSTLYKNKTLTSEGSLSCYTNFFFNFIFLILFISYYVSLLCSFILYFLIFDSRTSNWYFLYLGRLRYKCLSKKKMTKIIREWKCKLPRQRNLPNERRNRPIEMKSRMVSRPRLLFIFLTIYRKSSKSLHSHGCTHTV